MVEAVDKDNDKYAFFSFLLLFFGKMRIKCVDLQFLRKMVYFRLFY